MDKKRVQWSNRRCKSIVWRCISRFEGKNYVDIDEKLNELQKELLRLANSKADYEEVANEINRLRELKQNALVENAEREGKRQRIIEMAEFLDERAGELEEYDELLVRRLIEKVTVFAECFKVEFKSGARVEV